MIIINGKKYKAETVPGFDTYNKLPAKIVSGVNTHSGEAVSIMNCGVWEFINPLVQ